MGSIVDEQGGAEADVSARMGLARVACNQLPNVGNLQTIKG
jgi:hypothetical protein